MSLTARIRQSDIALRHIHSLKHAVMVGGGVESTNSGMIFDRFVVCGPPERKYGAVSNPSIIMKTLTPVLNYCLIKRLGLMSDVC